MNKIVLAQIDTIAGDIQYNFNKISENIINAEKQNADIIVFPEVALFGFPYGDIINRHSSLLTLQEDKLAEIVKLTDNIAVVLGFISKEKEHSVAVIKNGKIISVVTKTSPQIVEIDNEKYGIIIGEYNENNSDLMMQKLSAEAKTIIHCSISSSKTGKEYAKNNLLSSLAKKYSVNYIYVNQAGYGDNYCFDGASRIYNQNGEITLLAKSFEEDFIIADGSAGRIEALPQKVSEFKNENFSFAYENDLDRIYRALICGIRGYFKKTGFKKAVLGLSGGLDSTVCAVLLADALGKENVYAISMPTKITSQGSKNDADKLVEKLGINLLEVPISSEIDVFTDKLNSVFAQVDAEKCAISTTFENIQARIRATILWSISNECRSMLPIATSDKSEAYIGYATTNGDMSGGFAPIADVTKTKLFALADFMNKNRPEKDVIPQSVLKKPPGAELKFDKEKGRTITAEEDNMPYPFLDEIIWHVENRNFGYRELVNHKFLYEKEHAISQEQKEAWIAKFFDKAQKAIFKWHIFPISIIVDSQTINDMEYYHPIVSKFIAK